MALVGAEVGAEVAVRHRSLVGGWFVAAAVVQFAVYSWAGEKFAWLAMHPLIPVVLLAGVGAQAFKDRSATATVRTPRFAPVVVVGIAAVLTVLITVPPAITDGADTKELLVTVQTKSAVPELTDTMTTARRDGRLEAIRIRPVRDEFDREPEHYEPSSRLEHPGGWRIRHRRYRSSKFQTWSVVWQ